MFRSFQRWILRRLFLTHPKPSVARICRAWLELEKLLIESDRLDEDILHNFHDRIHDVAFGLSDKSSDGKEKLSFIMVYLPTTNLQLAFRQLVFAEETNISERSDPPIKLSYDYLRSLTLMELWRHLQTEHFLKRVSAIKMFWALPTITSLLMTGALLVGLISIAIMVGMVIIQGGWEKIFGPLMVLFNHAHVLIVFAILTVLFAFLSGMVGRWFTSTFVRRLAIQLEKDSQNNLNYAHCMTALKRTNARLHSFIERSVHS